MPTRNKDGHSQKQSTRLMAARHDMQPEIRAQMIELLNRQLADTFDLYSLTKQAHWNVKGEEFFQLHELYDELAETVLGFVDIIAERATALGGPATGTVRMAAGATRLNDLPPTFLGSMESVELLADCYAKLARTSREAIHQAEEAQDMDTSDLFIDVSRELDKALWFLESHLEEGRRSE